MKNIFLAIVLFSSLVSFAQSKDKMKDMSPATKSNKFIRHWTKELNLSAGQQSQAKPIIMTMFTKMGDLRADTMMERRAKARSMMNVRKNGIDSFKTILTPDQSALFDKRMQEMREQQQARKGNKKNGKGKPGDKGMKKAAEEEIENEDIF